MSERELPNRTRTLTPAQAFDEAVTRQRAGRLDEAEQLYRAVLKLKPDHVDALTNLAGALYSGGRLPEALAHYERAAALRPQAPDLLNNFGNALAGAGRHADAVVQYERALQLQPGFAEIRNNLGAALFKLDRRAEAIEQYEAALALKPAYPEAHTNVAIALAAAGRHAEAAAHFERALALGPATAELHNDLGTMLAALDRNDEAIGHYEQALALRPDFAEAFVNLGDTLAALKRSQEALARFDRALLLAPHSIGAMIGRGRALLALDRPREAAAAFERVLDVEPEAVGAMVGLGRALMDLQRIEDSVAWYEKALRIAPDAAAAHSGLGAALEALGRLEEARRSFESAVQYAPRNPATYLGLAFSKRFGAGDPHLGAMQALAEDMSSHHKDGQIALHFALGKAYADLGEYERSFDHLLAGNALKRGEFQFDEKLEFARFERVKAAFTPELMQAKRGLGETSDVPVFILGMPRSGTTLTEQMLASHPNVFGAGELGDIARALMAFDWRANGPAPYPEVVRHMGANELRQFGKGYVETIRARAPGAMRITDKMPSNFLFLGMIHLALPNARIIHTRRDPVDNCLSCFSLMFGSGFEWTYDLGELGRHYRAYDAMMQHWRKVLPEGAMLEVQYEETIEDFEAQARRIVAYCGLDWDDRCLAFYENKRPVRTASVRQVRQPIYRSSVGRWRPYAHRLGPLLDELGIKA